MVLLQITRHIEINKAWMEGKIGLDTGIKETYEWYLKYKNK